MKKFGLASSKNPSLFTPRCPGGDPNPDNFNMDARRKAAEKKFQESLERLYKGSGTKMLNLN